MMDKEDKAILDEEIKNLRDLRDAGEIEGVKLLVADTRAKVLNSVAILAASYFDLDEQKLKATCATLAANLDIYQKITGAATELEALEKAME